MTLRVSCGQTSSHLPHESHNTELNTNLIWLIPSAISKASAFNAQLGQTSAHLGSSPQVSQ